MDQGCITYEDGYVLEAVRVVAVGAQSGSVFQHETDLDQAGQARGHESVAKDFVHFCAEMQFLRVAAHAPPGQ